MDKQLLLRQIDQLRKKEVRFRLHCNTILSLQPHPYHINFVCGCIGLAVRGDLLLLHMYNHGSFTGTIYVPIESTSRPRIV